MAMTCLGILKEFVKVVWMGFVMVIACLGAWWEVRMESLKDMLMEIVYEVHMWVM